MSNFRANACLLFAAFALAGCSASNGSAVATPATIVVAGEFSGTVSDSVGGTQTANLVLAQHGTSLGGTLTMTAGTTSTTESVALAVAGTSLSGSGVMTVNGTACTLAIAGTYANTGITATYTGASGCTRSGSWSLQQICAGSPQSVERRTEGVAPAC